MSFTSNVILSKTVILVGGWAFVRGYTIQTQKHHARLSTNRSSFFIKHKHSTPLFGKKTWSDLEILSKKDSKWPKIRD